MINRRGALGVLAAIVEVMTESQRERQVKMKMQTQTQVRMALDSKGDLLFVLDSYKAYKFTEGGRTVTISPTELMDALLQEEPMPAGETP